MKPSDFYLGVVNFLGVLVPGAVLLLLRGFRMSDWGSAPASIPEWLIFGAIAYLIGQFLLAATEIFNEAVQFFAWGIFREVRGDVGRFRTVASARLANIVSVQEDSDQSKFHTAVSYLRLNNPEASGEVDHHMADYKLLRNLIVVLAIDGAMRAFVEHQPGRAALECVLVILCIIAFVRMYNWAQLLAFQYVCLILAASPETAEGATKPSAADAKK